MATKPGGGGGGKVSTTFSTAKPGNGSQGNQSVLVTSAPAGSATTNRSASIKSTTTTTKAPEIVTVKRGPAKLNISDPSYHGPLNIFFNDKYCRQAKEGMQKCSKMLPVITNLSIVFIIILIIITFLFMVLVCFLVSFTLFCVKERRRRRRRKRRGPKKTPLPAPTADKKDEVVDVEMDTKPADQAHGPTPLALPGMEDESDKDKKEEKGAVGFFNMQMRKLTKLDEDDEFEQPDAAGPDQQTDEQDNSKYTLAKDRFDAPPGNAPDAGHQPPHDAGAPMGAFPGPSPPGPAFPGPPPPM